MPDGMNFTVPDSYESLRPAFPLELGKKDPREYVVRDILWRVREFDIYRIDIGIFPLFSRDPALCAKQKERYLALGDKISDYNHLLHSIPASSPKRSATEEYALETRTKDGSVRQHYEREFARCIAQALLGQPEEARKSLETARKRLCIRIANRARMMHLVVNLFLVIGVVALGVVFARLEWQSIFAFDSEDFMLAIIMGSVGALFSTIVGLRSLAVDPTIEPRMHIIYAIQRVMVGALGALILYFGLRSGLLTGLFEPPTTGTPPNGVGDVGPVPAPTADGQGPAGEEPIPLNDSFENYWLSFVCLLAGFSERLVPNLLDTEANGATPSSN